MDTAWFVASQSEEIEMENGTNKIEPDSWQTPFICTKGDGETLRKGTP